MDANALTGAEINEAVARKLGWEFKEFQKSGLMDDKIIKAWIRGLELSKSVPDYCHSIAAAWEIVQQPGLFFEVKKNLHRKFGESEIWWNYICNVWEDGKFEDHVSSIEADTAPMAICLAFLKIEDK